MVLQKVGGGGKTYRLADNLSTDYKDFTELDELWNQQLVDNQQIMEVIAASDETMDLHARTPFVMDAVSASSTARDAIWNSDLAFDAVAAVNMAIGKYAVGYAGLDPSAYADMDAVSASSTARDAIWNSDLAFDAVAAVNMAIGKYAVGYAGLDPSAYADMDAVSTSSTAMDAVSTSSTAMDAVSASSIAVKSIAGSALALWPFLSSPEANTSFWSNDTGTEAFWDYNGDLSDAYFQLDDDSRHGGKALFLDCDQFPSGGDYITWTIDLTDAVDLTVYEKTLDVRATNFEIVVGGTTEFSASNNNNSYEGRTVDVSGYSGDTTVEIGLGGSDGSGHETLVSDIQLS